MEAALARGIDGVVTEGTGWGGWGEHEGGSDSGGGAGGAAGGGGSQGFMGYDGLWGGGGWGDGGGAVASYAVVPGGGMGFTWEAPAAVESPFGGGGDEGCGQGLTLVRYSAQPKPFCSHLPVSPCLIDGGKSIHPTCPTKYACTESNSERVSAPGCGYAGGGAVGGRRAYIFNVCVAPHRRRQVGRCRLPLSNPHRKRLETKRSKLKCDEPLSNFAFNFNLRRHS